VAVSLSVQRLQKKFQIRIVKSSQSVSHSATESAALWLLLFVKEVFNVVVAVEVVVSPTATITGQCGTGVTIQYATADGEHATFTGNVACTT
jgi:hypothetical protein